MKEKSISELEALNFKQIGITWIGKIGEYNFELMDDLESENLLLIRIRFAPNENKNKLFEYFDSLQKEEIIANYGLDKDVIVIQFIEKETSSLQDFFKQLVNNIESIGFCCKCCNCDNTENLNFYTNGVYELIMCDSCAEGVMSSAEEDNNRPKKYFLGFVVSLLGAFIGSILWIVLGMVGFIASIAGLAIAYCAFKGYELAKAKLDKIGVTLVIISIVIAFLFAQVMGLYLEIHKELPNVTFGICVRYVMPILFRDKEFVLAVLRDFGLGILFIVLGAGRTISANIQAAKKNKDVKIEKVEFETNESVSVNNTNENND